MKCPRCGEELSPNATVCPKCSFILNQMNQPNFNQQGMNPNFYANGPIPQNNNNPNPNVPQNTENMNNKKGFSFKAPGKGAKSFAAIFTAILFCPALFCVVINYVFMPNHHFAGYVVGVLAVLWCFFVLPVLKLTPTPITVLICFMSLSLYGLYIAKGLNLIGEYIVYAIPICVVICILFGITCILINKKIAKGMHIPALISAETAVFLMSVEAICEYNSADGVRLGWSLICMAILVSFSVICEAIAYAANGKK